LYLYLDIWYVTQECSFLLNLFNFSLGYAL